MIHSGQVNEADDGFVTIEKAERIRRAKSVAVFRVKNEALYLESLQAAVALKIALQGFQVAKVKLAHAADGVNVSDLLDSIELDCQAAIAASALGNGLQSISVKQAEIAATRSSKRAA